MSSSTKLCGWNRGLNCSTSTSIGSWAQSFVTTIILNDHHARFILPLPVGSQTHLKSPNHSHLDNVIFDQRKVVRSRRPSEAFPHPVAFWCQKDSSSAHCQVLAILQLEGERSSKVLRYRRALQRGWHHRVLQSERSRSALQSHGSDQAKAVGAPCSDLRPRHFTSGQGLHHYVRSLPASTSDLWPKLQSSRESVSGLDVTISGRIPPAIRPRSRPPINGL